MLWPSKIRRLGTPIWACQSGSCRHFDCEVPAFFHRFNGTSPFSGTWVEPEALRTAANEHAAQKEPTSRRFCHGCLRHNQRHNYELSIQHRKSTMPYMSYSASLAGGRQMALWSWQPPGAVKGFGKDHLSLSNISFTGMTLTMARLLQNNARCDYG